MARMVKTREMSKMHQMELKGKMDLLVRTIKEGKIQMHLTRGVALMNYKFKIKHQVTPLNQTYQVFQACQICTLNNKNHFLL